MPKLFLMDGHATIGEISAEQLQQLQQLLVEEDSADRDYYVSKDTLEMLEEDGLDATVLGLLKQALGDKDEMDIGWEK